MALDRELVGRSYPPSAVYEVGRGEDRRVRHRDRRRLDPVHRDAEAARAAGHPDVIAPPTFAIAVSLEAAMVVLDDPDVGIDYSRVVHGEQRFTHHRPIRAGDRLVATTTIDAARTVAGNDLLTARVDLATEDGEAVCTATSMLVARGGVVTALADVAVGTELPEQVYRVTRADLVRYAGASGDFNPIHWNERVATDGRPARRHRARHVHHGAGRPRGHRLDRRPRRAGRVPGPLRPAGPRPGRRRRRRGHRPRHGRRPARRRPRPRRPHRHQRRREGAVPGPRRSSALA